MSAECGNKWTKEVVDSLSASYEIGEQGVDLNEALELCIPAMEQLCASDCPDDWLLYSYEYLRAVYFPENFSVEKGEVRGQAVRFYVTVLNQLFERERKKVPFDPVRDYALLEESEMKYTRIRDEYERFLRCVTEEGVYAFMRLSKSVYTIPDPGTYCGRASCGNVYGKTADPYGNSCRSWAYVRSSTDA